MSPQVLAQSFSPLSFQLHLVGGQRCGWPYSHNAVQLAGPSEDALAAEGMVPALKKNTLRNARGVGVSCAVQLPTFKWRDAAVLMFAVVVGNLCCLPLL
jgi:hypothetical protein